MKSTLAKQVDFTKVPFGLAIPFRTNPLSFGIPVAGPSLKVALSGAFLQAPDEVHALKDQKRDVWELVIPELEFEAVSEPPKSGRSS